MAKKTAVPAARPNLFAAARVAAPAVEKKPKGTAISMPKDLDDKGNLTGESKLLNEAIHDALEAAAEEKAAKNKSNAARGILTPYVQNEWAAIAAQQGPRPPTPITVTNHRGESLSYVIQDRTQQNSLCPSQVEMLENLLGKEVVEGLTHERTIYALDPNTLAQQAAGPKSNGETVQEVVFEIISTAIIDNPKLSDEQKASVIAATSKTLLKPNTFPRMVELCGPNIGKIAGFLDSAGSAIVRYLK